MVYHRFLNFDIFAFTRSVFVEHIMGLFKKSCQTLPFALSFLHCAPSFGEFQNGLNLKGYLGSNILGSPQKDHLRFDSNMGSIFKI